MRETKSSIPVSTRLFLAVDKATMSRGCKSARVQLWCCGEFGGTAHKNFKTSKNRHAGISNVKEHFFCILSVPMRLVSLISRKTKEYFLGRHLCIHFIANIFNNPEKHLHASSALRLHIILWSTLLFAICLAMIRVLPAARVCVICVDLVSKKIRKTQACKTPQGSRATQLKKTTKSKKRKQSKQRN